MSTDVIISHRGLVPGGPGAIEDVQLDDAPGKALWLGWIVAFLFFVVLLGWASVARLDAAAAGEGQVTVAGNRQTVQHRDGGIVRTMQVREGQHVAAGQVLFELEGAEVVATERALAASVIDLQAQRARLEAEIRGGPIAWPDSFAQAPAQDLPLIERAKSLQAAQQRARQSALAAGRAVLRQQAAEASSQGGGYAAQSVASARQRASLQEQLERTRRLAEEGYVSRNQVAALERSIQQLEGADAEYAARAAATRQQVGEARESTIASERRYVEDAAALLRDTQFQLNETLPKWLAARDQVDRTVIRAPVAGQVVGLEVFTVGGVIQAGQPILDIVPDAAPLVIRARFAPGDIDGVQEGREAEVKFLSIHERDLPILLGTVRTVSADSLTDEQRGLDYFTAEVEVPREQMARLEQVRGSETGVRPGVPVQIFVKLRPRTALQYMLDPLFETMRGAMREH